MGSYVFLYGYDAAGDGDYGEESSDEESDGDGVGGDIKPQRSSFTVEGPFNDDGGDDGTSSSSSSDDSLLSGFDRRGGLSDDDETAENKRTKSGGSSRKKAGGVGGGGGGGGGGGESRRKTMFAEMKRESLAGTLQPVGGKHGQRQRRSSGDDNFGGFHKMGDMGLLGEEDEENEEEEEEEEDGDKEEQELRRRKSRLHSANHRREVDEDDVDSDAVSELSATSDVDGAGNGEHGGSSSGDGNDQAGGAEPRFLIYFWAGARSKKSDWVLWKLELAKTMIPEWQKVRQGAVELRRLQ